MKTKILLFILAFISLSINAQNPTRFANGVQVTGGITTDNNALKVVVQSANNVLNTISKTDLQDAFYFATASALPVTGITDKLYITRDDNKLYRFNGTIYVPMSADVSGKENTANKQNSLAVDGTGVKFSTVDAVINGLETKQTNYYPISFIEKFKDPLKDVDILILGDSNYATPDRMVEPFIRNTLKYKQSNGIGFFSLNENAQTVGINEPIYTGTWVNRTIFSNGFGLDGKSIYSSTVGSAITVTPNNALFQNIGSANNFKVLYRKSENCTLEIATDGGTFTNYILETNVGGDLGIINIPFTLSSSWNLRIRLKSGQVELVGCIASNSTINGVKIHKSASSGANTGDFSSLSNSALWKQTLTLVKPDVILIGLSTNDVNQGVSLSTIKTNLSNIYNNIRSVNNRCAIYFVVPPKNNDAIIPITSTSYLYNSKNITNLAENLGAGIVPIFDNWSVYPDDYTDTLFGDGIHYNNLGAYINAELLAKYLNYASIQGVVGSGDSDVIPKFKNGILVNSNIFNDGTNLGIGINTPNAPFSFKNQVTFDDTGVVKWGLNAQTGVLSWDTGKAIIKAGASRTLNLGANEGENLIINTDGSVKINSLSGTGTRLVSASPTGQLGAISTLPVFADNTAAIAGGLGVGSLYRTVIGLLAIVF